MTYFLDTNVIIDLLNGNSNVLTEFKNAYVFGTVRIPDLVYYEVFVGLNMLIQKINGLDLKFLQKNAELNI